VFAEGEELLGSSWKKAAQASSCRNQPFSQKKKKRERGASKLKQSINQNTQKETEGV